MPSAVVLITGCSAGGIGAALAAAFHDKGCTVYASARRLEAMTDLPAGVHKLRLDICDTLSINTAVQQIFEEQGRIDVLVNNAGLNLAGPLMEVDLEAAKKLYDANVWGLLAVSQAVAPHMTERRQGKIVNVGSIVGEISTPFCGIYCSSKSAVHSITNVLRLELAPFSVQVMLVVPGAIQSNIGKNTTARLDLSRVRVYAQYTPQIEDMATPPESYSTPTSLFAQKVVAQVLRPKVPRHFWYGFMALIFRTLCWAPLWLLDRLLAKRFKLNKPAQPVHVEAE